MNILENHLEHVRQLETSNCDARPDDQDINLIVIHCISLPPGKFGGSHIDKLFLNELDPISHPYFASICELKVSSHLLIDRKGKITQYVPFHKRAWHAGKSSFEGRRACNDFSIGIELEGTEYAPYADEQYSQLALVIQTLIEHYPKLSKNRIVGHSTIAPGRKTDPGDSFEWFKLRKLLTKTTYGRSQTAQM